MEDLRRRPTYEELINYIEIVKPKIKYPDRFATFLRNSHYLSQFGNLLDIEEQQKKNTTQQIRETEIRHLAANTQQTASILRGNVAQEENRRTIEQATRSSGARSSEEPARSSGARGSGEPAPSEPSRMFDDVIDTAPVAAMGEIDAALEVAREEKATAGAQILRMVTQSLPQDAEMKDKLLQSRLVSKNLGQKELPNL